MNTVTNAWFIIERNQRLSSSILWNMQRNFFVQQGIDAWRQGIVPHYITSNPFIANAYVQLVAGFLRDYHSDYISLDRSQPIYIVELGAGSGRFAFHFLKKFQNFHERSTLKDIPIKYVMTDFTQRTIDSWQAHPLLQPLVEQGQLDYAKFDVINDIELKLIHSGEILSPGTVRNPLIVIANYFFDGIPQDAFYIEDGHLYESLVSITSPNQETDLTDPDLLNRIEITYEHRPVNGSYYDDPACNHILQEYQQQLTETFLLFPCAPIDCIRKLGHLSKGRLLLLTADKGYSRGADLQGRGQPGITVHGSFSITVNYHALGKYIVKQGGQVLHTAHRHNSLDVSAFVLGTSPNSIIETRQAYATAIEQFGPDDFFTLKKGIEKTYDTLTIPQIISYLRLSGWDANIFLGCFPALLIRVDHLSGAERQELSKAIQQVWETYYPIGEERDLAFNMGMLLYGMEYYADALYYFQQSLMLYGPDVSTIYNMGMCYYCMGQLENALECINQALALEPTFQKFREMRVKIEGEINCVADRQSLTTTHQAGLALPASGT